MFNRIPLPHRTAIENPEQQIERIKWKPPKIGFKLTINGAKIQSPSKGETGGVFRNFKREWILNYLRNLYAKNNTKAKLIFLL